MSRIDSAIKYMKSFLTLILMSWLALMPVTNTFAQAQKRQGQSAQAPNILLIVADDLRANLGDRIAHTPNLKRLARRGVTFERAYVQYPVCNPSRVSLLTGLRPETTGITGNGTYFRTKHPDLVTLPQLFKQNGYFTASLGKIFHRGLTMEDAKTDWADEQSWSHIRIFQSTETGLTGEGRRLAGDEAKWCHWIAANGNDEDQPDGMIASEAVKLIKEKQGQSWFIGAGFHKPHDPFIAPKKYFDLYPLEKIPLASDPTNRSAEVELAIPKQYGGFANFTDRERREFKRAYLAGVSFMDAQVGKLLDALDQTNQWQNTVVVFMGDHGYHLGERGWWNKDTLFELSARAPLIIAAPGAKQGVVASGIVELLDLYPTLIDFARLAAPHKLEGVSLRSLLGRPNAKGKDAAFTLCRRGSSIRTERWRYTEWDGGAKGEELYDHRHDAGEFHNLANDPQWTRVKAELKQRLQIKK